MSENGFVKCNIKDGIGEIQFYHPKSNSLPSVLLGELAEGISKYGRDPEVKVILLYSKGEKSFCAGASFDELLAIDSPEKGALFFSGFAKVIMAIKEAEKFVVAKVQGKTVGGGVGILCASDYVIAKDVASVKLSELSIGIGPFVIGEVVRRKIGLSNFSKLSINSSEWFSAKWAFNNGMYSELIDVNESLEDRSNQLLKKLAGYSSEATKQIKGMFWEGAEGIGQLMQQKAKQCGSLVLSDFTRKTLMDFKKK